MADENEQTSPEEQALADEWAAALSESGDADGQDDIDAMLAASAASSAGLSGSAPTIQVGRDSRMTTANMIMGTPTKWVWMLRGSRW